MTRIIGRAHASGVQSPLPRDWRTDTAEKPGKSTSAHAVQILLHARQQARAITHAAEEAAQATIAVERQLAWQQGYAEGKQQAFQQNVAIAQRLAVIAAGAVASHEASARNMDRELASLAVTLARLIVRHEIALAPETVLLVARAALQDLSIEHTVTLRVHEGDAALVQAQLPALGLPETVRIAVVGDLQIAQGGCIVESGAGRIEATVGKQLERLERLLHDQLDAASP